MVNNFQKRKTQVLSRADKSSIGKWDDKIKILCEKINSSEDYYTSSSCSGRIILMVDQSKKGNGLFRFVSHEKVILKNLLLEVEKLNLKEDIKFKQDSCILHVVCKDISSASSLLNTAQQCGWKKSGILSLGKNIIVELCSSERIEFPLIYDGVLLVDKKFLQVVLKKSNFYLERCWKKIEKLEQFLSKPLK